jgi:hypothetical protein
MSRQAKLRSVDDFGLHGDVSQEVKRVLPCQLIRAGTLWIYGGSLELVVEGKIIGQGRRPEGSVRETGVGMSRGRPKKGLDLGDDRQCGTCRALLQDVKLIPSAGLVR